MPATLHPPTLDYRFGVPGPRVETALRELMAGESMGIVSAFAKLFFGLALCLVGPLIFTIIFWRFFGRWDYPFGKVFLAVSCLAVPLLMWLERRTGGEFLERALDSITPGTPSNDPWTNWEVGQDHRTRSVMGVGELELALWGPRLLWNVIDWYRERPLPEPATRVIAAEMVVELFDANNSRRLVELIQPGRPPDEVLRAAQFLIHCQWAIFYADSQRLRLREWIRRELEKKITA